MASIRKGDNHERAPAPKGQSSDQGVRDSILRAIFEQRIPPGTKLGEESLASIFNVSRGRIRRVLLSLSHLGVVDLRPNRGAFVVRPSEDDARDVFNARCLLEELVVKRVIERIDQAGIKSLHAHVRAESVARDKEQRREAIRMAGEFHLLLAKLSGSRILISMMENLIPMSSLIVGLFGAGVTSSCSVEDHGAIVQAIRKGDSGAARSKMMEHLRELEETLRLDILNEEEVDLAAIFGGASVPRIRINTNTSRSRVQRR